MRHIKSFVELRKEADVYKSYMRTCENALDAIIALTERHFKNTAKFADVGMDFKCVLTVALATEKYDGVQLVIENETRFHDTTIPFAYGEYVFNIRANLIKAHKLGDDFEIYNSSVPYITKIHINPNNDTPIFIDKMISSGNIDKYFDTMMSNVSPGIQCEIKLWLNELRTLEKFVIKKGKGVANESSNSG